MKNFKNIGKSLSRNEMRNIGGGRVSTAPSLDDGKAGCCYLHIGKAPICGLAMADAQTMYNFAKSQGDTQAGWCCASC